MKQAFEAQQLLVLNFDDPDAQAVEEVVQASKSVQSLNDSVGTAGAMPNSTKSASMPSQPGSTVKLPATAAVNQSGPQNFDPNVQEYEGIDGLPHQMWDPMSYEKRADFMQALGI